MPHPIVVMGVSGCGKSTIGARLAAARPGTVFVDADDLHPAANRAKMAAGIPLTDSDREPWLRRCGAALTGGPPVVMACSALRRRYRDRLRSAAPDIFFVHLHADPALLAARLTARRGHFMPAGLLASQLATLEPLDPDENGVSVDAAADPDAILRHLAIG